MRKLGCLTIALALGACDPSMGLGGWVMNSTEPDIETVTAWVRHSGPALVRSRDGLVQVEFPPLSVADDTEVSLSREILEGQGPVYVLGPPGLELERPARISFRRGTWPTGVSRTDLRLARQLGTAPERWALLERPERTSEEILGRCRSAGRVAAIDVTTANLDPVIGSEAGPPLTSEADVLLSRGELAAAKSAYRTAVSTDQSDPRALFGHALAALLALPSSDPVRGVLARCHLTPLTDALLFGAEGYFVARAQDLAGRGKWTLLRDGQEETALAESVVSRPGRDTLEILAEDRDAAQPWMLRIVIDLQQAQELYRFGADLSLEDFPGEIFLESGGRSWRGVRGAVHVEAAGRAAGQAVTLTLEGVELEAEGAAPVTLNGVLEDVLELSPAPAHPLFTATSELGPPYRGHLATLMSACDAALTAPYLYVQAQQIVASLEDIAEEMRLALDLQEGDLMAPAIPSFLLRVPDDLVVTRRDVTLFLAAVELSRATIDLLIPYVFFGYDEAQLPVALKSFLLPQDIWIGLGEGMLSRREEALSPAQVAADLSRNFMRVPATTTDLGASLVAPRNELDSALAHLAEALQLAPTGGAASAGLITLEQPDSLPFKTATLEALQAFRASLAADAEPVAAPNNPGYRYRASAFFADPPSNERLRQAVSQAPLFEAWVEAPEGVTAAERNPRLRMTHAAAEAWLSSFLVLPPTMGRTLCNAQTVCPGEGLICDLEARVCEGSGEVCDEDNPCPAAEPCMGHCTRIPFEPVPEAVLRQAIDGDPPPLWNTDLWRALAPLGEIALHPWGGE